LKERQELSAGTITEYNSERSEVRQVAAKEKEAAAPVFERKL
jgi:hypothetical protein